MKSIIPAVTLALAATLNTSALVAGPNKDQMPPGQMKKSNVPPGLAKKGGLPPGIAKKYRVGERIPGSEYVVVEARYRDRLPYGSPQGREWVRVGRDLYLMTTATGVIVDVIENWLDP
jgi:Ni/Co efflux regulator RcnB